MQGVVEIVKTKPLVDSTTEESHEQQQHFSSFQNGLVLFKHDNITLWNTGSKTSLNFCSHQIRILITLLSRSDHGLSHHISC
jgi:hypothetical protein